MSRDRLSDDAFPFWAYPVDECLSYFDVSTEDGLDQAAVERQREKHGLNELDAAEKKPLWELVLEQFDDLLVKVCGTRSPSLSLLLCPNAAAR